MVLRGDVVRFPTEESFARAYVPGVRRAVRGILSGRPGLAGPPLALDQPLVIIIIEYRPVDVLRLVFRLSQSQTQGLLQAEGEA